MSNTQAGNTVALMDRGANIMKQLIIDRIEANEFCRDFPKLFKSPDFKQVARLRNIPNSPINRFCVNGSRSESYRYGSVPLIPASVLITAILRLLRPISVTIFLCAAPSSYHRRT